MAHLSEDKLLIEAFRSGHDFHSITASRVFDVPADDVTVEMRAKIKAMNYGLAYGLSAFGLGQQLGIEPGEARGLMDEYFETFGGIRDYLAGVVDEARKTGFTETIMGRRRYLPDLTSDNRHAPRDGRADGSERADPGVGGRPDQGRDAARRSGPSTTQGLQSRMLLQVHDELVFDVAAGEREALESARPRADGRRGRPRGPARRLRRHRPQLARGGALAPQLFSGLRCRRRAAEHAAAHQQRHDDRRRSIATVTTSWVRVVSAGGDQHQGQTPSVTSTSTSVPPGQHGVDQQLKHGQQARRGWRTARSGPPRRSTRRRR